MPQNSNLDSKILRLTQAKAFSKSQNMPPTFSLLFKAVSISLSSLQAALLVEELTLNPNCSLTNVLLTFRSSYNLAYITFSKIFKKEVS